MAWEMAWELALTLVRFIDLIAVCALLLYYMYRVVVASCVIRPCLVITVRRRLLTRTHPTKNGRRQGRKGLWKGEAEGGFEERQGWTPVPCWQVSNIVLEQGGWLG